MGDVSITPRFGVSPAFELALHGQHRSTRMTPVVSSHVAQARDL